MKKLRKKIMVKISKIKGLAISINTQDISISFSRKNVSLPNIVISRIFSAHLTEHTI